MPYDLVYMDVQMPEMDGLEATARLRQREREREGAGTTRLPVVATTAHAMASDRERCLAAGMDISKPIRRRDVIGVLRRLAGRPPRHPPLSWHRPRIGHDAPR